MKTILAVFGAIIGIVMVLVLCFGLSVAGIRLGGILQQEQMNANRNAVQHSQQYVETKQTLMLQLLGDANDPEATDSQRAATINRLCQEATLIDESTWPNGIPQFVAKECKR